MSNDTHCAKEDLGSDGTSEYPESSEEPAYSDDRESGETPLDLESVEEVDFRHKIRKRQVEGASKRRWRRGRWHAGTVGWGL